MILIADARHIPIKDKIIQCVVTSPPYWGLRDYGNPNQLGVEQTPEEYIANMVAVFREVWRVMRDDGVAWLNLGDCYASKPPGCGKDGVSKSSTLHGQDSEKYRETLRSSVGQKRNTVIGSLKPKDLVGIPWRVAFALQDNGWYLRQDIIWSKPNPMPESVKDRCTRAHEYIFMLTKKQRYFYDGDAIKEHGIYSTEERIARARAEHKSQPTKIKNGIRADKQRGHSRRHAGFNDRWDAMTKEEQCSVMRNKRSVWSVTTKPYPDAHYAVFPEEIPKLCILAGSRKGDIILDPFGGSGTTGKVAVELGRKVVCMDISQEYAHKHMKKRMRTTIGMF